MKREGHVQTVEVVDRSDMEFPSGRSFLSLHRLRLRNTYRNGDVSAEYSYDAVLRKWLDAVVLILTARIEGRICVCLRSCIRPPLILRNERPIPFPSEDSVPCIWELPAGLIEPDDLGLDGIKRRASAEAREETGFILDPGNFTLLKGTPYVSPGVLPERLWYLTANIAEIGDFIEPEGDGSPVEERSEIWWVPLDEALGMCDEGEIDDMKTELGLRRLAGKWLSRKDQ